MRILVVTREYFAHHNSFCAEDAVELAACGNDVCVIACARADHNARLEGAELKPGSGHVRVLAPHRDTRSGRSRMLARTLVSASVRHPITLWRIVRAARRRSNGIGDVLKILQVVAPLLVYPTDVVHIGWLDLAARCVDAMPVLEAPIVVTCHGSDLRVDPLEGEQQRSQIREVFERVDLVHCVSDDLRRHAIELGLDPSKAFVCPFGIDTRFFCPAPHKDSADSHASDEHPSRPLRVVSVGRLHWVKGYEYALQALEEVRQAGVEIEYSILGRDNGGRLSTLTAIRDFGLEDCVSVPGARSRTDVLDALRSADVFLLSSVSEGLNTATLEAMAVGVPVVVTDVGGMREVVTDGVDGLVVPPRDPRALANALVALADDPARRKQLGVQGRRRVDADFNITTLASTMHDEYHRLASERMSRRRNAGHP